MDLFYLMLSLNIVDEMLEPHIHRPSLHGAEENNASGRDRELARCVYSFFFQRCDFYMDRFHL